MSPYRNPPKACARCGSPDVTSNGRCRPCNNAWARAWRKTAAGKASIRKFNRTAKARVIRQRFEQRHGPRAKWSRAESRLRLWYGIDFHDWALMYERQGGACAGCSNRLRFDHTTHVDHCHSTGGVRGLLCNDCNVAIGYAHNSSEICRRLAAYLEDVDRVLIPLVGAR